MRGGKPALTVVEGGFAPGKPPAPPSDLPAEAKKEWRRVAPILHQRRLLGDDAAATLEAYCRAVSDMRTLGAQMAAEGYVIQTPHGPKTHPAWKSYSGAMRDVRLYAAELGLTPHRRGKYVEAEPRDEWEGMIG